jgi:hypothetical protein
MAIAPSAAKYLFESRLTRPSVHTKFKGEGD